MAKSKAIAFRGAIQGLLGFGEALVFTTKHPEGQATALYRYDAKADTLATYPLPSGGGKLIADDERIYLCGLEGQVHAAPKAGGAPSPLGPKLEAAPLGLALLADDGLAVLLPEEVLIIDRAKGEARQRIPLEHRASAIAAHGDGVFFAVGSTKGHVTIFDKEEKASYLEAESGKIHGGAVNLMAYEPDELKLITSGADGQFLITYTRGELEPEARAGKSGHSGEVLALDWDEDAELFYTLGADSEIKTWPREGRRPSNLKRGVVRGVALARVEVKGRPHLVEATSDDRLRFFLLDDALKPSEYTLTIADAYAQAAALFERDDAASRDGALDALAKYNDAKSIEMLAERATSDGENRLRVKATKLLADSGNRRAVPHLRRLLSGRTQGVRFAALEGLRGLEGQGNLEPLKLALDTRIADVGVRALDAVAELAPKDDVAMARLLEAIDDNTKDVRLHALVCLERLHEAKDPTPSLLSLKSRYGDLRYQALLRLLQRDLLGLDEVGRALRKQLDDGDDRARDAALLLSLLSVPKLGAALRYLDADLHRRLYQLEHADEEETEKKAKGKKKDEDDKGPKIPKAKKASAKLSDEEKRPLFEALACRTLDVCLSGATFLALLGDGRAFGTLLQLSREGHDPTRVAACKALEALDDPRALQRLRQMLRDSEARVRDAAYTAVAALLKKAPLEAVEAGLDAPYEDVRSRALAILVGGLKKKAPKGDGDPAQALLERALNDGASAVRNEAFRVALRLKVNGGDAETLRFTLRSLHADLRRQAVTEVMGEIKHEWAWGLLLEIFNDPDPSLRKEALEFALKKGKGKGLAPLEAAFASRYADLRLTAIDKLGKKKNTKGGEALLVGVLADKEEQVRQKALDALESAAAKDALVAAMGSDFADVRVRAAAGRAALGDARALDVLLAQIREEEPEIAALRTIWGRDVTRALHGLNQLGRVEAVEAITPLVEHEDATIRQAAAHALTWCLEDPAPLQGLLHADDAEVKIAAALGLARFGDASGAALIFPDGQRRAKTAHAHAAFAAAVALGSEDRLEAYLDDRDQLTRWSTMRLLLLQEWIAHDGAPRRCLAILASANPLLRLYAAEATERFYDAKAMGDVALRALRQRGTQRPIQGVTAEHAETLALALSFGSGKLKFRAATLLTLLKDAKSLGFKAAYERFTTRYADELAALAAAERATPKAAYTEAELGSLVFGAYAGLSRQGGYSDGHIRVSALKRLQALAQAKRAPIEAVTPVLVQALSDQHAQVRMAAFDALEAIKTDAARLSTEALATGMRDVGAKGLERLSAAAGEGSVDVLTGVMQTYTDGLEHEAVALLVKAEGVAKAWAKGLDAKSSGLRDLALQKLASLLYEDQVDPVGVEALERALGSRFPRVRLQAAVTLGQHKRKAAFKPLVEEHLAAEDGYTQRQAVSALQGLGDKRAVDALIDRVVDDPSGTADVGNLLTAAAHFQVKKARKRLTPMLEERRTADGAYNALKILCGYDQRLELIDDDPESPAWLKDQRPRDDEGLAALLDRALELNKPSWIRALLDGAAWSRSSAVDAVLARCGGLADDGARRLAVQRYGWRVKRREAPTQPLIDLLEHKDAETRFYAAEGLALAGHKEGLSVLLSSVELLTNIDQRRRAVAALGLTGDRRVLDALLRLADEEEHALQEDAAEALGHLSKLEEAPEVFKRLERLAKRDWDVGLRGLRGLRHFGTPAAWALIRARAADDSWRVRQLVAELLAEDKDEGVKALLAERFLEDYDWDVLQELGRSLRKQWGEDSLEPDYLFVQLGSNAVSQQMRDEDTLERLSRDGDPVRLFEILHKITRSELRQRVVNALLNRDPQPVEAALAVIEAPSEGLGAAGDERGAVAAHVIGRAPTLNDAAKAAVGADLSAGLDRYTAWQAKLDDDEPIEGTLDALTTRLERLIWAAGRHGVGDAQILRALRWGDGRAASRGIRRAAIAAAASGAGGEGALEALRAIALGQEAALRALAADALRQRAPQQAEALLADLIDDRQSLNRLIGAAGDEAAINALRLGAAQIHTQGLTLPHLARRGDVEGLAAVAQDAKAAEAVRQGALMALASIATGAAQDAIAGVAKDEKTPKALRKAAWRALRRAKRARMKTEVRA